MKFILLFCSGLISFSISAQTTGRIEYADNLDFNWGLFRGKINSRHLDQWGNHTGAVTVSTLSYSTEVRNHQANIRITALFNPNESWTKYPRLEHPDEALNHEKRHFQICEIYARKIRQIVSNTHFTQRNFNSVMETIFKKLTTEYRAEQNRYDRETEHSLNKQEQAIWNTRIDNELRALKDYEISKLTITLN